MVEITTPAERGIRKRLARFDRYKNRPTPIDIMLEDAEMIERGCSRRELRARKRKEEKARRAGLLKLLSRDNQMDGGVNG